MERREVMPHVALYRFPPPAGSAPKGELAFLEFPSLLFTPQRVFWISEWGFHWQRGGHAHRACYQFMVVTRGAVRFTLKDTMRSRQVTVTHQEALYIEPLVWVEMQGLSDDNGIFCLCSELYDEKEYIRSWDEFVALSGATP